jgi:hypothetical protein
MLEDKAQNVVADVSALLPLIVGNAECARRNPDTA